MVLADSCNRSASSANELYGTTWELEYISGPRIAFEGLFPEKKPQITFDQETQKVSGTDQFEAAARSLEPRVRLGKLNTEAEQQIAGRYEIRGIPTMILFKGGKEIARQSGAMSAVQIAQWAQSRL